MNAATTVGGAVRDRPRSLGYRPPLDGIRAVAILAVLGFHSGTRLVGGFIGVDIFFALSGFLITTLLLQEWSRTHTIRLGDFYRRRARRLLPALFLTITGVGLIYAIEPSLNHGLTFPAAAGAVIFYIGNWVIAFYELEALGLLDHTWSLAIEEQFYILWPPLLLLCLRRNWQPRRLLMLTLILACASAALRALLWAEHIGSHVYFRSDTRADGLLLGCALAVVYSTEAGRRLLQRCVGSWVAPVIAAVVLLGFGLTVGVSDRFVFVGGLSLVAVCSVVLIAHVVMAERSWVTRTLGFSTLAWIGARSYGMYLFHIPIFRVCGRVLSGQPGRVVVPTEIALTMLAAAASYRWVESYFLRRSRHPVGAPPHVQRFSEEGQAVAQVQLVALPESNSAAKGSLDSTP
jgi:peptidoglycan/LPS O-acetylase OafA/YrhL